mgnify:CR=1 FL=1
MPPFKTSFKLDKITKSERIAKRIARAGLCSRRDAEKLIVEKKAFCEFNDTITLRKWQSGFKQGNEFSFNCSSTFSTLANAVTVHLTNFLNYLFYYTQQ